MWKELQVLVTSCMGVQSKLSKVYQKQNMALVVHNSSYAHNSLLMLACCSCLIFTVLLEYFQNVVILSTGKQ